MKTKFKALLAALVCLLAFQLPAAADNDKPISIDQLPAEARQTLRQHFKAKKVALSKMESGLIEKSYDVIFTSGEKVEFDRNGRWTEISCRHSAVPAALVPAKIAAYVRENYAGARVLEIERDRKEYEVKLSNGYELTFDTRFRVVDIDR